MSQAIICPCCEEEIKQCSDCEEVKTVAHFSRNESRLDGLDNICSSCRVTRNRRARETAKRLKAHAQNKKSP